MDTMTLFLNAVAKGMETTTDEDFIMLCKIQKWLMDEHQIYIAIAPKDKKFSFFISALKIKNRHLNMATFGSHNSWSDALLAAIQTILTQIPNKP